MKKVSSLFLILCLGPILMAVILQACYPDPCPGISSINVISEGIEIDVNKIVPNQAANWNSLELESITSDSIILPYASIALFSWTLFEEIGANAPQSVPLPGISSAYACSPAVHYIDTLTQIEMISDVDYSSTLVSGTDLVSIINVHPNRTQEGMSLEDYFRQELNIPMRDSFIFSFNSPPDEARTHQFDIRFRFSDGKILSVTTQPITITP